MPPRRFNSKPVMRWRGVNPVSAERHIRAPRLQWLSGVPQPTGASIRASQRHKKNPSLLLPHRPNQKEARAFRTVVTQRRQAPPTPFLRRGGRSFAVWALGGASDVSPRPVRVVRSFWERIRCAAGGRGTIDLVRGFTPTLPDDFRIILLPPHRFGIRYRYG